MQALADPTAPEETIGAAAWIDFSLVLSTAPIVTSSVINPRDPEIGRALLPVCTSRYKDINSHNETPGHVSGAATTTTAKQDAPQFPPLRRRCKSSDADQINDLT